MPATHRFNVRSPIFDEISTSPVSRRSHRESAFFAPPPLIFSGLTAAVNSTSLPDHHSLNRWKSDRRRDSQSSLGPGFRDHLIRRPYLSKCPLLWPDETCGCRVAITTDFNEATEYPPAPAVAASFVRSVRSFRSLSGPLLLVGQTTPTDCDSQ